jgi:hypothetical protein
MWYLFGIYLFLSTVFNSNFTLNPMMRYRSQIVSTQKTQFECFKEAAREFESDENEARWDDRLRKVVKHKPAPEKPN